MKLTANHIARINQALAETHRLLAKELGYRKDLQKHDMVSFYRSHIAKLESYLASGEMPDPLTK